MDELKAVVNSKVEYEGGSGESNRMVISQS